MAYIQGLYNGSESVVLANETLLTPCFERPSRFYIENSSDSQTFLHSLAPLVGSGHGLSVVVVLVQVIDPT